MVNAHITSFFGTKMKVIEWANEIDRNKEDKKTFLGQYGVRKVIFFLQNC